MPSSVSTWCVLDFGTSPASRETRSSGTLPAILLFAGPITMRPAAQTAERRGPSLGKHRSTIAGTPVAQTVRWGAKTQSSSDHLPIYSIASNEVLTLCACRCGQYCGPRSLDHCPYASKEWLKLLGLTDLPRRLRSSFDALHHGRNSHCRTALVRIMTIANLQAGSEPIEVILNSEASRT